MSRDALHHSIRWNMKMIALLVRVLSKAYKGLSCDNLWGDQEKVLLDVASLPACLLSIPIGFPSTSEKCRTLDRYRLYT